MPAVGIWCQTRTAWAFTMVQFNSGFQINKKSAAFKIHQTTKAACVGKQKKNWSITHSNSTNIQINVLARSIYSNWKSWRWNRIRMQSNLKRAISRNTMTSDATPWNTLGMLGSLADNNKMLLAESQKMPRICHISVQYKIKPHIDFDLWLM